MDLALTHPHMVDDLDTKKNATFASRHWQLVGSTVEGGVKYFGFACRFFNKSTRLCEAHDKRPPVCQGYPWYDGEPGWHDKLPEGCSFWADVPPGAIKLPIVEIKKV